MVTPQFTSSFSVCFCTVIVLWLLFKTATPRFEDVHLNLQLLGGGSGPLPLE